MKNTKSFEFLLISPTKENTFTVEWIDVETPTGNFVVGPDHSPLISVLKERSKLQYKQIDSLKPEAIDIYGGFLKIENGKAIVSIDL